MYKDLEKFLKENYGYIKTQDLKKMGFNNYNINSLLKKKILRKVAYGLYIDYSLEEDELYIYQLKYPLIVYSYNTAFYLHKMSERVPHIYDVTVPRGKRIKDKYNFCIHQVVDNIYQIGTTKILSPLGNPLKVYNLERCICDIIKKPSQLESELLNKIISQCFKENKIDVDLLIEYSKKFNIYKEIKTLIGVMAK